MQRHSYFCLYFYRIEGDKLNALLKCRFTFIDAYWLLIDQYLKKNQNVKNNQKGLFLLNREF